MCKFSMVTRSQQQAAWPGLQNSGTNTRNQAACSGNCVGQWSLPYPSLLTGTHSCSTCAPCIITSGAARAGLMIFYRTSEYCADISVSSDRQATKWIFNFYACFFFFNAFYPSATREFAPCVPRLWDHFFQQQAEWIACSLHSVLRMQASGKRGQLFCTWQSKPFFESTQLPIQDKR